MGRLRSSGLLWAAAIISLWSLGGCGGHRPPGASTLPARITLNPSTSVSLQLGSAFSFTASAQNDTGNNISATFTFASSDTSIMNIAPNGVACAGHFDAAFTTCTPEGTGMVEVTASALGATSSPTFVFVHPPIDHITVTGILPPNQTIQEPCLSQSQPMMVQAQAFSQGSDITATVGPFVWSANNPSVVKLVPFLDPVNGLATNQATAIAATPGITQIYASASGVSSSSFQQPQVFDKSKNAIPIVFDFFETCPIQNITLDLDSAGSQRTSFATTKGTSETVIATVTDVMGNSSLPNTNNGIVLSKIPLVWTASQPVVVAAGTNCIQSCTLSTASPGAGSVTASCSPPTCNIGFPEVPTAFSSASALAQCAQYFPPSCQQYIPVPVYASPRPPQVPPKSNGAISGVVTGAPTTASVLATSLGCSSEPPAICNTSFYGVSTARPLAGNPSPSPATPNSVLFDPAGIKAYMGSDFGAQIVNAANLGGTSNAFTPLGTVTGKILAVSPNSNLAVFSDTLHIPNQVYVVNSSNPTAASSTALNIAGATTAAFSPDGLKAFIFGLDSTNSPNLYIYSTLQALQVIPLPAQTTVNAIAFSTNGAFAYVAGSASGASSFTVFNTCDNQVSTDPTSAPQIVPLAAPPISFKALPDGVHFISLENNGILEYITATTTRISPATFSAPASSICPMTVSHQVRALNLGQGSIQPIDFFVSPDGTLIYVLARDRSSVLIYDLSTSSTSGIQLAGNAAPVSVGMSADASSIVVAGSDGMLHQISTALGGTDTFQLAFPNLPDFLNPFCTFEPTSGPCTLDLISVKP